MTGTVQMFDPPTRTRDKEKSRHRRSFGRKLLFTVILLLLLGAGGIFYLAGFSLTNAYTLITKSGGFLGDKALGKKAFDGRQKVNLLLLGVDEPVGPGGSCRSDTIKVITVDFQQQRISMLSIPRDTWVTLPAGHGEGRINGAHQLGGNDRNKAVAMATAAVENFLSELTGQPFLIDGYVRIQTASFEKVITALGGIDIEVEKQMDYEDPSQELFIHLKPGYQHLTAKQAVGYVRFRHDAEGDYGRIRRQDKFLRTLVAQINQPAHKERMLKLVGPLLGMVSTDIRLNDAEAVRDLLGKLGGMDGIQSVELPTVPTMKGAASVVEVVDREAAAYAVSELLNGPRPTVIVINGTKRSGLARDVEHAIDSATYHVTGIGTSRQPIDVSVIYATARTRPDAERLAAVLGLPALIDTTNVPPVAQIENVDQDALTAPLESAQITVVLGKDFHLPTPSNAPPGLSGDAQGVLQ